ncbi:hypothetical protein GCM10009676_02800 [Prauserella halophila]|uniref:PE family protein n=1 Tax=Prauserella halophila TaxID=185641 RepID=A0ABN1VVP2_9PSEU|nr:hypothetical protein [Prauserella halophila]MCP2234380.1 hypothetical protein [Prauserella halophila]
MTSGTPVTGPVDVPAGAFAVAPELAEDALQRISELQDVVGRLVREAKVLGRSVPLGGGYAGEIGEFMARYGIEPDGGADAGSGAVSDALVAFGRELADLRTRIGAALEQYRSRDEQAEGELKGVDCQGG